MCQTPLMARGETLLIAADFVETKKVEMTQLDKEANQEWNNTAANPDFKLPKLGSIATIHCEMEAESVFTTSNQSASHDSTSQRPPSNTSQLDGNGKRQSCFQFHNTNTTWSRDVCAAILLWCVWLVYVGELGLHWCLFFSDSDDCSIAVSYVGGRFFLFFPSSEYNGLLQNLWWTGTTRLCDTIKTENATSEEMGHD